MATKGVTWFAQMEAAAATGQMVAVRVDRATGKTTVRPIDARDLDTQAPPIDFQSLEARIKAGGS